MEGVTLWLRREFDKNVARLVDDFDVPRATSAPPHLQEEGRWSSVVGTRLFLLGTEHGGQRSVVSSIEHRSGFFHS